MTQLQFRVDGARPMEFAVSPHLLFSLHIAELAEGDEVPLPIHSIALRCQIRIEAARRVYSSGEQGRLFDLFGSPLDWGRTLRGLLWTHTSIVVPRFTRETTVEMPVACTFDFNVAGTKYFDALETGEVPLCFLFSGTVFHDRPDGGVQVAQIPWDREAVFRLPVETWKRMMDLYYPNSGWLCLRKEIIEQLEQQKRARGIADTNQLLEHLLAHYETPVGP